MVGGGCSVIRSSGGCPVLRFEWQVSGSWVGQWISDGGVRL